MTALDRMDKCETGALRLANLEVLINAILYNPQAALHIMEASRPGRARVFFDMWFAAIQAADKKLPRVHDKRLCIIALSALLELDEGAIPESLKAGWPELVRGTLTVFKDLPKAIAGALFRSGFCLGVCLGADCGLTCVQPAKLWRKTIRTMTRRMSWTTISSLIWRAMLMVSHPPFFDERFF